MSRVTTPVLGLHHVKSRVNTIEFFLDEYSGRDVTRRQSPKVWRHKKIEFDKFNYGIFGLFWKNNIQKAYLPTISIPGKIVFVILAQLCSDYSKKILLNLTQFITLGTESNLEGFVWSHRNKTGLRSISETICSKVLFFASRPFRCSSFKTSQQIPWFWRHHFRTLLLRQSGDISCISILALSIKIQLFLLPQPHLFLTHVRRVKFLYFEILLPPLRFFNLIRLRLRYLNFPVI